MAADGQVRTSILSSDNLYVDRFPEEQAARVCLPSIDKRCELSAPLESYDRLVEISNSLSNFWHLNSSLFGLLADQRRFEDT